MQHIQLISLDVQVFAIGDRWRLRFQRKLSRTLVEASVAFDKLRQRPKPSLWIKKLEHRVSGKYFSPRERENICSN